MNTILQYLSTAWSWALAHPAIVWPLLTLVLTALFKPRTDEQRAKLQAKYPRLGALIQIVAALGLDAPKLLEALGKVGTAVPKDPPPPKGPSLLPVVFVVVAGLLGADAVACRPPVAPRETARATVLVVADAVKQLDTACAAVVTATKNAELGIRCADGYDSARAALLGAEKAVDAYESAAAKDLPCAVALAVDSLGRMAEAVRAAGGKLPAIVDDAFRLAPLLTVACRV